MEDQKPLSEHKNLKPYNDRVIVRPNPKEETTKGGIVIPDTAKERPQRGVIIAVGPGKHDRPMEAKEGENVLYGKYSGTEIENDGETLLIMREDELLTRF